MKLLIIVATLGLATFAILRRKNPELAQRVEHAARKAAGRAGDEVPGGTAPRVDEAAGGVG